MKKIFTRHGHLMAAFALVVATYSANFCFFIYHQPKIPESVMRLKGNRQD